MTGGNAGSAGRASVTAGWRFGGGGGGGGGVAPWVVVFFKKV
jgi:hypothetical protein